MVEKWAAHLSRVIESESGGVLKEGWLEKVPGWAAGTLELIEGVTWRRRYVTLLADRICWGSSIETWRDKELHLNPSMTVSVTTGGVLMVYTDMYALTLRSAEPRPSSTSKRASTTSRATTVSSVGSAQGEEPADAKGIVREWASAIEEQVLGLISANPLVSLRSRC